ncbi:MAG: DNA topoisomerase IB [Anaerolineae bacterium]|nr:DNA topoisomerase IB [Anaerolineae bacterium]
MALKKKTNQEALAEASQPDPKQSAKIAGLRYVNDDGPGIQRRRRGKGFQYIRPDGETIQDPDEKERINALAIPPAWDDVWISPWPNSHLQATGRDAEGRKQYRYHPKWREVRSLTKYAHMVQFGQALPLIRDQVDQDLSLRGLPRRKVLAAVVRLLGTTFIRIGNEEYVRENGSFGLTTMRDRHVEVKGSTIHFQFRGKSGQDHDIDLRDRRLARIVKKCRDIPGYELFQYIDEDGQKQTISSEDVNDYLREITEQEFTAKDFRTWGGTVLAALALKEMEPSESQSDAKKNIVQAIKEVAECLGNRPATCRKYYVHPAVLDSYLTGDLLDQLQPSAKAASEALAGLDDNENAVLHLLRHGQSEK